MPFHFRRSIRIAPGVRLNVGRRGVSASATLPGTGISYTLTTPHRGAGPRRSFTRLLGTVPHDRCGKDRMLNEVHTPERQRAMPIRDLVTHMRHDGCGGRAGRAELLAGIEAASSRPVRRILLITNPMLQPASIRRRWTKEKPPPGVGGSGG